MLGPVAVFEQSLIKFPRWQARKLGFEIYRPWAFLTREVRDTKRHKLLSQFVTRRDAFQGLNNGFNFFC